MFETERTAITLKPTALMLEWLQSLGTTYEKLTLSELQRDRSVLLLPLLDDDDEIFDYINGHFFDIFVNELESWTKDETTWPNDLSINSFHRWFDIEIYSRVYDLENDEYFDPDQDSLLHELESMDEEELMHLEKELEKI